MILAVAAAAALEAPSRDALIQKWLRANRAHVAASLGSGALHGLPAPPNLRSLAARELETPGRYHMRLPHAPPEEPSLWERFWHWLGDRWDRLWGMLTKRVHVSERAANAIGWALLIVVALVLLWTAARLLANLQLTRSRRRAGSVPLAAPPDPQHLYRQACDAAARMEYGAAALLLFAATVALLDLDGAVSGRRSATVGDLRRELRGNDSAMVAPFDTVAAPFVQTAYAERPIDRSAWERAQQAFTVMLSLSKNRRSTAEV